ncbi:MAG: hypothetical protein ACLPYZ_18360 [Limisphaerales bacterium]
MFEPFTALPIYSQFRNLGNPPLLLFGWQNKAIPEKHTAGGTHTDLEKKLKPIPASNDLLLLEVRQVDLVSEVLSYLSLLRFLHPSIFQRNRPI